MPLTAHLFTRVILCWECPLHREREHEVEVDYTFDGETVKITAQNHIGIATGISDYDLDEMIWEAVCEGADEAYAEYCADYADQMADAAYDLRCERELELAE